MFLPSTTDVPARFTIGSDPKVVRPPVLSWAVAATIGEPCTSLALSVDVLIAGTASVGLVLSGAVPSEAVPSSAAVSEVVSSMAVSLDAVSAKAGVPRNATSSAKHVIAISIAETVLHVQNVQKPPRP